MGLAIIEPAAEPVVSLDVVKQHLRLDTSDDDGLVDGYVTSVTDWLAGRNGWLGMSLGLQSLEFTTDRPFEWPQSQQIRLPRPPLIEIVSIVHIDDEDEETTLVGSTYRTGVGPDGIAFVRPVSGSWPAFGSCDALRIRYTAGHPAHEVPEGLRQAVLMTVGHLYGNRGDGFGDSDFRDDPFIHELFAPYRVWGP